MHRIKILIADDEPLVRIGVKSSIDWEANGFELIAEASNGEQALRLVDELLPEIVITDIKMPVMDGIELIREIKQKYPHILCLVLSCHDDYEYVREAMKLGAEDYFLKTHMVPDSILKVIGGLKGKLDSNREKAINESKNKRILGECISILTDNFIKDLISDLFVSRQELEEKLKLYNLGCMESKYALLVLQIDDFRNVKKKYVEKDEKLLQFSIKNMLEELYGRVFGFRMFIDNSEEYIICWPVDSGAVPGKAAEQLVSVAQKAVRIIKDYLNISISVGISLTHKGLAEIKDAYGECKQALKFKFFRGKGCIVAYSDIRRVTTVSKLEIIDEALENELKLAVKALDCEAVSGILNCIENKVLNCGFFVDEKFVRKVYINLIEAFNVCLREENMGVKEDTDPYRQVLDAEDIGEIGLIAGDYFKESISRVLKLSEDKNRFCINQALEYINSYYDREISLQFIGEKVGLNPSYFSRFFKKETGESFIDYLTRVRIERSKQLLSRGMKAFDVAEKVGYPNYTYFSKLFKKVVGVNPSDYVDKGN